MCMDRAHESDRVTEIGTEKQQVTATLGDSVDDGVEIYGRQRIGGLVDDLEAVRFGICLRRRELGCPPGSILRAMLGLTRLCDVSR